MTPSDASHSSPEHDRLATSPDDSSPWRLWGPYLSGRQWGTVREDYSASGDAWDFLPFDQAHQRAYRWGEDGIAGLCDRFGFLNLAVALWNRRDDRLKERYFGLSNAQGNHGEDVKEYWFHLDATPTHSYAQQLYRYPQAAFPYADLVATNAQRDRTQDEYELIDTGVLADDRFFDVVTTHAKAGPTDVLVQIEATNHGPDPAPLDLVPQLWFRNTWAWGEDTRTPRISMAPAGPGWVAVYAEHGHLGDYRLAAEGRPELLFCDNESNNEALWGSPNRSPHPKDAVDRAIVHGDSAAANPAREGTKVGLHYSFDSVAPGETVTVRLRLSDVEHADQLPFAPSYDATVQARQHEADRFYDEVIPAGVAEADRTTARRAFAGLHWCKQHYRYEVRRWLQGDDDPPAPPEREEGRNHGWTHLYLADVISMPDEWEYPWFAAWDLAFHCVALAHVDPAFAKNQLILLCREWAQHPDGQLPAYEWAFGDVNPPVHAWAAWQVYQLDGCRDHDFLVRVFGKLLINYSWWINRKDPDGSNLFSGGFLGLDNIAVFDRSNDVPEGYRLHESDATSWMAFFCSGMLRIAVELARKQPAWDDLATTFLERFVAIARAASDPAGGPAMLWDEQDGFYYDELVRLSDAGACEPIRVRSLVGLLPLLAVAHLPEWINEELPAFCDRLRWLRDSVPGSAGLLDPAEMPGGAVTLTLVGSPATRRLLARMLDESEFLSPYGVRSLSAVYRGGAEIQVADTTMRISYDAAESTSPLFGGNSNWRGPVWMPVNVLLADALRTHALGPDGNVRVECPVGSRREVPLDQVADELDRRLMALFRPGPDGRRPSAPREHPGGPRWDHPVFSEYFHGDTGRGLGASHQTGWSGLVAHLICRRTEGES